ncbi:hypothetical protein KSP40_PGU008150 [Platanthera guangdongensis]|uniref:C2 domain-containing protein n=1 Tax=Platanthera guangdongensis TaxID=2320717 RepID=A0ABR2MIZ2_9ASPA
MAGGGGKKLVVEVFNARNLMPKDGQGTASAYVVVDFDGQRRRMKTKNRDLHPQWEEKLEFFIPDPDAIESETLELNVYNDKKNARRNTFLGKVKISGSSFAKLGDELLIYYPLEKRSVFSQVKGEIGIKVFYVDDDPPAQSVDVDVTPPAAEEKKTEEKVEDEIKTEEPKTENKPKLQEEKAEPNIVKQQVTQNLQVTPLSAKKLQPEHAGVSYDLVDRIPYLFIRILKAKQEFKEEDIGLLHRSVFAKIIIGSYCVRTRTAMLNSDWDQAFAFHKESLNSFIAEISVNEEKDGGDTITESILGAVSFDLSEIPKRLAPDSPLAPQWYTLESSSTESPSPPACMDLMLAIWIGTQADEAFTEAWQSDSGGFLVHARSKAYLSPKLWYLRLTVIQTQDLRLATIPDRKSCATAGNRTELFVKAQLGGQSKMPPPARSSARPRSQFQPSTAALMTAQNPHPAGSTSPATRHDLMPAASMSASASKAGITCSTKPHTPPVTSRAASKQLSKPPVGLLEVGVRGASNLVPMKLAKDGAVASGRTDAYAVLKYGPKWARTRTIVDQFNPCWNEQYTWDVFDPCTVFTVAVFDNSRVPAAAGDGKLLKADSRIGKIRIRLSTLDTNRVYLASYPLTTVTPMGMKKMGELELAVRFTCASWLSLMQSYAAPLLPRMHYVRPLGGAQQDVLRHMAARAVATRLARSEPPLGPEVVHHMLDADAPAWSMRRSRANWFRLAACLSHLAAAGGWVHGLRTWTNPMTTVLAHLLVLGAVTWPEKLVPAALMCLVMAVACGYRKRAGGAGGTDTWQSWVDGVGLDELDEELDGVPTSRPPEVVRARYDRLRALAGRAQGLLGEVAAQGERMEALVTWRDPRATGIFVAACVAAAAVFYAVPFRVTALALGFYYLRHPRFRGDMPAAAFNFYRRLPSMADRVL